MASRPRCLSSGGGAAMGFSLVEISIVMACISLLGFLIADNLA